MSRDEAIGGGPMKCAYRCVSTVLFAVCVVTPMVLRAQTTIDTSCAATARDLSIPGGDGMIISPPVGVSSQLAPFEASFSCLGRHGDHGVEASSFLEAHAAVGDLGIKISGEAVVPDDGNPGHSIGLARASAFASVSWRQDVPFTTTGVPSGEVVRMFWDLFLEGDISVASNQRGSSNVFFQIEDIGVNTLPSAPYQNGNWGRGISQASQGIQLVEEIPGGIRVSTLVSNGAIVRVGYSVTLSGSATSDDFLPGSNGFEAGFGGFSADVSGSFHWGGVASVTDLAGNVIPRDQWSFVSDTGFDYAKSFDEQIPEPTALALFITGAFVLEPIPEP